MTIETIGELASRGAWWEPVVGLAAAPILLCIICCVLGETQAWWTKRKHGIDPVNENEENRR